MRAEDPNYVPKLEEIWSTLADHIKEEETHDLPALENALQSATGLTEAMVRSSAEPKAFVPTRSHSKRGGKPAV